MRGHIRHRPLLLVLCLAGTAGAQPAPVATIPTTTTTTPKTTETNMATPDPTTTGATTQDKIVGTGKTAGRIASQPARDVGAQKVEIPPAVQLAAAAPYSLSGLRTCAQLGRAIFALDEVLGPDYAGAVTVRENRAGKLAQAGGKSIVNAFVPFRGLVREVSGAAPAERRLDAAIKAAIARRGFLRGVATARKCRPH